MLTFLLLFMLNERLQVALRLAWFAVAAINYQTHPK